MIAIVAVVQLLSCVWLFATPWTAACQVFLSFTEFAQTYIHWGSNHLILCHPLLLLSIFPSIWVVSSELVLHIRWPKDSASVLPMNVHSWFPLGLSSLISLPKGLSSLLQHHSLKASILQCSTFFMIQLSRLFMTTGKTIALIRRTFVGNVSAF